MRPRLLLTQQIMVCLWMTKTKDVLFGALHTNLESLKNQATQDEERARGEVASWWPTAQFGLWMPFGQARSLQFASVTRTAFHVSVSVFYVTRLPRRGLGCQLLDKTTRS